MEGPGEALSATHAPHHPQRPSCLPTRSVCRRRCFRRRRLCFRMSLEEVLCSVELLSLGQEVGGQRSGARTCPQHVQADHT